MLHKKHFLLFSSGIKKKPLFFVLIVTLVIVGAFSAIKIYADNANFDLYGIGWSAQGGHGVGWVVLNSENPTGQPSGASFKVSVKNKTTLDGAGWASIKDPKTGKDSYGWLSFDTNRLTNCPTGECKATLDYDTGKIRGWARFICVAGGCGSGSGIGSWDGWVSLRNDDAESVKYGLCLGRTGERKYVVDDPSEGTKTLITGENCFWNGSMNNNQVEVNGIAWGGPSIGGWVMFGFTAPVSPFGLTPAGPVTLFPKEKQDFSVEKNATWFVNNILGGNAGTVGSISPQNTVAKVKTTYQATNSGGPFTVKASSTASNDVGMATTTIKFPYTLNCDASGTSTMVLTYNWSKAPVDTGHEGGYTGYAPHTISITRNGTALPAATKTISSMSLIPGSYLDKGLSTSTKYTYVFTVKYTSDGYSTSTQVNNCEFITAPQINDTPSKLKAFGADASTIYVNWKDNTTTTKAYKFSVQRIKLTPASSTDIKVLGATDSSINFQWKNNTTSTPYFNWIERSTSTSNRFLNNLPPNDASNDKAMVKLESVGSTSPSDGLKTYSYFDGGLQDATTYYYRVKACSTYKDSSLDESYKNEPPALIAGKVDKPNPVCGKYAPSPELPMVPANLNGGGTPAVATTTPPMTPTRATSTALYNKSTGVHSITLRWNDNSKRESGYQIWREGILIHEQSYNNNATGTLAHVDTPSSNNKNNSALSPGTNYSYEIRGYYIIPAENGGNGIARVYSDWVYTNTDTYYQVDLATSGGGSVTGSGDLAGCSGSCTAFFPWTTNPNTVTVSATADADYTFTGWTGVSCICSPYDPNCNKRTSCTFGPGNSSVTGNFRQIVFTLSAFVTGNGNISGSGINCGNGKSQCSTSIEKGSSVLLVATPGSTSTVFKSWGRDCSGTNSSCSFTMPSRDANASATFEPKSTSTPPIVQKGSFFADLWSNAKYMWKGLFVDHSQERVSALSASLSQIVKGFEEGWGNITSLFSEMMKQAEEAATKLAQESAKMAEGQSTGNPLDIYFKSVATTTAPVYVDKNLEADTVYLYRVRVVYEDGSNRITEWSNSGATKTLRDNSGGSVAKRGVCTRNSYCDFSVNSYNSSNDPNAKVKMENTEQQCSSNIDCKEVGRYGQSFQER